MDRDFFLRAIVVAKPGAVAAYIAWLRSTSPADSSDEVERFQSTASPRSEALAELLRPGAPALAKLACLVSQRRQAEKHPRGMARHLAQKLTALELPVEIVPLQERDAHEARDSDDCVLKIDEVYMSLRTRRHKAVL